MDWLKELLKKAGVADTEVDKIDTEVSKALPLHFVPKSQYNEVTEAKKKAEEDVAERDKQIKTLGESAGLSEELKKQITTLQGENQSAKEAHESKVKDLTVGAAIKLALSGKAHDIDFVTGLINKENIEFNADGTIKSGLDEQVKTLQESKSFLFVQENNGNQFQFKGSNPFDGAGGNGGGGNAAADFGKRVADYAKANTATSAAQGNYFKNSGNPQGGSQ